MARRGPAALNCLLAIDKPVGITSHDAVARVRRAVGERRVGHAGTLDPLASGVLVIGIGQASRLLGKLALDRKAYVARIAFGAETATDDAEGAVTRTASVPDELADEVRARAVLAGFVGPQMQVPPAYSAISVEGVRSYARARAGEEVALPPRPIEVFEATLIAVDAREGELSWVVSFTVSKGTYIRSLARDIGRAAGAAAHLSALRRTASGAITIGSCVALDTLDAARARAGALDPVRALGLAALELTEAGRADLACGRTLGPASVFSEPGDAWPAAGAMLALTFAGELCGLAVAAGDRLRPCDVFPQAIGGVVCS